MRSSAEVRTCLCVCERACACVRARACGRVRACACVRACVCVRVRVRVRVGVRVRGDLCAKQDSDADDLQMAADKMAALERTLEQMISDSRQTPAMREQLVRTERHIKVSRRNVCRLTCRRACASLAQSH